MCLNYLQNLLFHAFQFVLSWFNLFLEFLDLVVQHKLELLQLLILLLQLVDSSFLRLKENVL